MHWKIPRRGVGRAITILMTGGLFWPDRLGRDPHPAVASLDITEGTEIFRLLGIEIPNIEIGIELRRGQHFFAQ